MRLNEVTWEETWTALQSFMVDFRNRIMFFDNWDEIYEYITNLGNDIFDMVGEEMRMRHPILYAMRRWEAEPLWMDINIAWSFPLFPLPKKMLRPEAGPKPNMHAYEDKEQWSKDYIEWVYRLNPTQISTKVTFQDILAEAEERNEKKRARYNEPASTLGSIEYSPPPRNEYLRQKSEIQARALFHNLPDR